jgi:hypothetical protein
MKFASGILFATALSFGLTLVPPLAIACSVHGNCDHVKGAPAPVAAAGLPALAIGYGVFWLVKRRRKVD